MAAAQDGCLTHPSPRASRPRSWHTWWRLSGPSLRRSTPCEVGLASGRNSAAVAPPALTEYRALMAAAQSGSGASIATSLATAVVAHLAAALGAVSTALDAV
ncbi:hypothetical protein EMIHUDRAFT_216129 [Emiliania huxleyi CCMP1516]|uniref:Uncharacterized protein n=2 Tax=Emiliania huxleyi TaxID=2903 RepID=A0A0D3IFG6_EMIH1|nr:hypothetical protein EMIHUDRAFT_216129 [Emiliania huxleyi CCMP1516]EOD10001.1 hypothetical protein EMIHUDRAFT_216129 [Emiliania huxleyi CCMP1516]|eukprot:XP_005762430.1 hypothetical protein EMIHUDRAFT_216129 [Emiliania huxleyi CCMP1516]